MPAGFVSAVCVVKKGGKYLLCKREDNGLWTIPGGTIEKGETLEQAAKRELFEETGIKATGARFKASWHFHIQNRLFKVAVFEATGPLSGKLTPSWESPEVAFVDIETNSPKIPLYIKNLLKEVQNNKQEFEIKAGPFEFWVILRYLYGRAKRRLRAYLKALVGKAS